MFIDLGNLSSPAQLPRSKSEIVVELYCIDLLFFCR